MSEEEIERLRTDLEDRETKLKLVGEKELQRNKKKLGCNNPDIDDPEKLRAWCIGKGINPNKVRAFDDLHDDLHDDSEQEGGKGSVGLRPEDLAKEQKGNSANSDKNFQNYSEMVSYLKEQIRKGDESAKAAYRELIKKSMNALKEKNTVWEDSANENEPSMIKNILEERNKKFRDSKTKGDS